MDSSSFEIIELPGTKIDILDGLDTCGLGVVNVSSLGSVDIPAFNKKYLLYRAAAKQQANQIPINTICVPDDAEISSAMIVFGCVQCGKEEFVRESLELQLEFKSRRGLYGVSTNIVILGPYPELPEGRLYIPSEERIQ
ncbi:MAG: hypothetical protein AAB618_03175 [Patescibacteria group bacterium]